MDSYKSVCEQEAQRWNAVADVHPMDFIFHFVFSNPAFETKENAVRYYFEDGFRSAQNLLHLLGDICGFDGKRSLRLLEFASGYGCVTRHLSNVLPFCITTSCDIHPEAVQFIREKLNTDAVSSASRPEDLHLKKDFDVVFALSFFSHMPKATFSRWLRKLASLVKPEGYLVFTTHGLASRKFLQNCRFDEEGFWYNASSEQKDISTDEYGLACTMPNYVFALISQIPEVTVKYYREGYWWEHQDVYCLRRLSTGLSWNSLKGVIRTRYK